MDLCQIVGAERLLPEAHQVVACAEVVEEGHRSEARIDNIMSSQYYDETHIQMPLSIDIACARMWLDCIAPMLLS